MAEIYAYRLGRSSIGEVRHYIEHFDKAQKTVEYWNTVLVILKQRFSKLH